MTTLTTADAARLLSVSPRTVRRAAQSAGIARVGRDYLLSELDISILRGKISGKSGCPKFVPGNDLWKRRKAERKKRRK